MTIAGLVLAGGRGSRLAADVPKPLVDIAGTTALAVALARLAPHCDPILVSANDEGFEGCGAVLVADRRAERLGPLAGLEAAEHHLRASGSAATHLLALPGDTPFLPRDVALRLSEAARGRVRIARSRGRLHPTAAFWPLHALADLSAHLNRTDGSRSVLRFAERTGVDPVDFGLEPGAPDEDPFFNVNTQADLARAIEARALQRDGEN